MDLRRIVTGKPFHGTPIRRPANVDGAFRVLRTERSHTGHARMIATVGEEPVGYIRRSDAADIPSPYAYSAVWNVYRRESDGKQVLIKETSHRCFKMYEVPASVTVYLTEDEAMSAVTRL
jgi:hypothetical protein